MRQTRKILVALDWVQGSDATIQYVGDIVHGQSEIELRLLHVVGPIPAELREHGGSENPEEEERLSRELREAQLQWVENKRQEARPLLEQFRKQLVKSGVVSQAIGIECMVCQGDQSVDWCLLEAAEEWGAGTIVVGWDAFPSYEELMKTHIAERLIRDAHNLVVWVVKR